MREAIFNLIKKTSTSLPKDVKDALKKAYTREKKGSNAKLILHDILLNDDIAGRNAVPICQDTGTVNFYVSRPKSVSERYIKNEIMKAVKNAVKAGYLRENAVDPINNKNTGNGVGDGNPGIHISETDGEYVKVTLLLKGGGSENVSAQYSLPDNELKAHRDFIGVKKCVVDAVFRAQGKGCAPGIIGVGIGGDRAGSYAVAKKQLLRKLDDTNKVNKLKKLEETLLKELNKLDIGPMGVGGRTTVLGVKAGATVRVPASFFVSVAYMCWALRRGSIRIKKAG